MAAPLPTAVPADPDKCLIMGDDTPGSQPAELYRVADSQPSQERVVCGEISCCAACTVPGPTTGTWLTGTTRCQACFSWLFLHVLPHCCHACVLPADL